VSSPAAEKAVADLVADADAAFAAGDAAHYAALFTDDARLYILHRDPAAGREAIEARWRITFERFDTSAWEPRTELVEVHGDHASVFATYTERLLSREDGSRTLVRGRIVYWLRRDTSGSWRIALLMNSHSHPMEPIPEFAEDARA
jgi:uncharacterized protein (TIGR02246 family)